MRAPAPNPSPVVLSPRLAAVAALVPAGRPMADIGTDHGRLPAFLVASGRVPRAVGVDDKAGPLAVAQALGAALGLGDALEYRLGAGCEGLVGVDTVTVAGMGGPLIARILEGARAAGARHIVLQPNTGEADLRGWLGENGWAIVAEQLVVDRGRRFVVLAAVDGETGPPLDEVDLTYGVAALHRDPSALAARLDEDEKRLRELLARHAGERAESALRSQLDTVQEARARLFRTGLPDR
ncbi:MAG: class I SAM-dependent methyltransferase [Pseudomonadota bacterium]|nr:class I SAM-dependent methyltransferase [Pseudomonadota bacterium]